MPVNMIDNVEGGVRVVRYPGVGHSVKWRGDCDYCQRVAEKGYDPVGGFFPDHQAMRGCRSGGRDHCTCDGCF
jgi:hypothetical protein